MICFTFLCVKWGHRIYSRLIFNRYLQFDYYGFIFVSQKTCSSVGLTLNWIVLFSWIKCYDFFSKLWILQKCLTSLLNYFIKKRTQKYFCQFAHNGTLFLLFRKYTWSNQLIERLDSSWSFFNPTEFHLFFQRFNNFIVWFSFCFGYKDQMKNSSS